MGAETVAQHDKTLTIGDWLVTLVVLAIPIVGFVMTLYWAFSSDSNVHRANFCKAALILWAIAIVISMIFVSLGMLGALVGGVTGV